MKEQNIEITEEQNGKRIDEIAHQNFREFSRNQWKNNGEFFLLQNEKKIAKKPGNKVKTDEKYLIKISETNFASEELIPWDYPLEILAESSSWVLINKPPGISVHPSASESSNKTIVNALLKLFSRENLSENYDEIEGRKIPRPGLVHRLDKVTSGVLLIAKNRVAHEFFAKNWSQVTKTYYAIVNGKPPLNGKIEAGISRDIFSRQKMTVSNSPKAKNAITFFSREKYCAEKNLSLLKINIPTGRTHQIRVHLSSINFPILGDTHYGGTKAERVFLHAYSLKFPDIDNNKSELEILAKIPTEFENAMQ